MIPNETLFIIDFLILGFITYEIYIADKTIFFPSIFTIINKFRKNKKNKN
jgi:hypothetical protein